MQKRFYNELWSIRFNKMLDLEEKSAACYEELHAECQKLAPGHAVLPHLKRLAADEKRHARLVRELLKILKRQHPKKA